MKLTELVPLDQLVNYMQQGPKSFPPLTEVEAMKAELRPMAELLATPVLGPSPDFLTVMYTLMCLDAFIRHNTEGAQA